MKRRSRMLPNFSEYHDTMENVEYVTEKRRILRRRPNKASTCARGVLARLPLKTSISVRVSGLWVQGLRTFLCSDRCSSKKPRTLHSFSAPKSSSQATSRYNVLKSVSTFYREDRLWGKARMPAKPTFKSGLKRSGLRLSLSRM